MRSDRAGDVEGALIPATWRRGVVAVVGLGKSGVAATRLLAREGVPVYASDASDHPYGAEALAGAALGFLWFNAHPAQVFMGDTGSLAIGGALGAVAIMLKAEFLLLIAGGVFAAEAVSVMLQVWVYRWHKRRRGKEYADAHRVFRMAPLHHHFEKLGWAEPQVVTRFYILGVLCAAIALATLKVR